MTHFDPQDVEANKGYGVLGYLGFLVILPILLAKESAYAKFHANQGLVLFIVEVGIRIIGNILMIPLGLLTVIPGGGWLFGVLSVVLSVSIEVLEIATFIFAIMGIIHAVKGEAKPLPIIGKYQILK